MVRQSLHPQMQSPARQEWLGVKFLGLEKTVTQIGFSKTSKFTRRMQGLARGDSPSFLGNKSLVSYT